MFLYWFVFKANAKIFKNIIDRKLILNRELNTLIITFLVIAQCFFINKL